MGIKETTNGGSTRRGAHEASRQSHPARIERFTNRPGEPAQINDGSAPPDDVGISRLIGSGEYTADAAALVDGTIED